MASAMSCSASGSIQVVTNDARFIDGWPSTFNPSRMRLYASRAGIPCSGNSNRGKPFEKYRVAGSSASSFDCAIRRVSRGSLRPDSPAAGDLPSTARHHVDAAGAVVELVVEVHRRVDQRQV